MPRGGQGLRSGRYHLDGAGRLHRWPPRSGAVAIVTVRARRVRMAPVLVVDGAPMFDDVPDAIEVPPALKPPPPVVRPRPPLISLKDAPSGMEQLAKQWRGAP